MTMWCVPWACRSPSHVYSNSSGSPSNILTVFLRHEMSVKTTTHVLWKWLNAWFHLECWTGLQTYIVLWSAGLYNVILHIWNDYVNNIDCNGIQYGSVIQCWMWLALNVHSYPTYLVSSDTRGAILINSKGVTVIMFSTAEDCHILIYFVIV